MDGWTAIYQLVIGRTDPFHGAADNIYTSGRSLIVPTTLCVWADAFFLLSSSPLCPVSRLLIEVLCGAMSFSSWMHTVRQLVCIRDMLCIKSSQAEIVGFTSCDVDFILESLCVS